MMAVKAEENPRAFHIAPARQVHAPVQILIATIIDTAGQDRAAHQTPLARKKRPDKKWDLRACDEGGTVPPSHRNRVFVLLVVEMIGVVSAKNSMVNQGVPGKRIGEHADGPMHHEPMEGPFKN